MKTIRISYLVRVGQNVAVLHIVRKPFLLMKLTWHDYLKQFHV